MSGRTSKNFDHLAERRLRHQRRKTQEKILLEAGLSRSDTEAPPTITPDFQYDAVYAPRGRGGDWTFGLSDHTGRPLYGPNRARFAI